MQRITIIGAGVVGMATASTLRREGHDVTVVDPRPPGEYCSFGNTGILSPGSIVPVAMPGILKKVPGYLMDPMGPLAIDWTYLPKLLPWLARFVAASELSRVEKIAAALRPLLKQTLETWRPLAQWAGAADLVRQDGYLILYETEAGYQADALGMRLRRDHGVVCEPLAAEDIRRMEPNLRDIYIKGYFLPEQGHVRNPLRLTQSLAAQFQRDGGKILQQKVLEIETGADGPTALITDQGRLPVETLVICAGAHSNEFTRKLGDALPLETQRGYHATFEEPTVTLTRPISVAERKFFVTPMEMGLRVAGSVELAGLAPPPNYARADVLQAQVEKVIPELSAKHVSKWMGHRPCMPDSLPVIGRATKFKNVVYAFGHGHVGLCSAAPTAGLVAEIIGGRPTNIDIAPYRPDRF
jgi:D-amino-acid dehydrogenase